MPSARLIGTALLSAGLLSACGLLGPRFVRPASPEVTGWATAPAVPKGAPAALWPRPGWWRGFGSTQLDAYISEAEAHNQNLAAAIARVREANAQVWAAGAGLLPTINAQATRTRQKSYNPFAGAGSPPRTQYEPQLTASYVLDFWGRNLELRRGAAATARATRYDEQTVALTVVTGVALTYFQTLELRDRLQVAESNLTNARGILSGLQLEARVGTATALDVAQQAATVAALDAAIPPLRQQLRQADDALAILIGQPPEQVAVSAGSLGDIKQPAVRPGLPSQLLARRPDVAAAEAQLRAANANIAAARAAFFPNVTLTTTGGFASSVLTGLISPAHRVYSFSAAILQPIFEGGAAIGTYEYDKARYTELLADYRETVLTALSNVEDALISLQQTAEQQRREQTAVRTARRAFDFAQQQLRAGVTNVLTELNTEAALFSAESALVQVQYAHLAALVDLYEALGGGWSSAGTPEAAPARAATRIAIPATPAATPAAARAAGAKGVSARAGEHS